MVDGLQNQRADIGFMSCFRLTFIGLFFNNFMLGSIGGDAVKCLLAARVSIKLHRLCNSVCLCGSPRWLDDVRQCSDFVLEQRDRTSRPFQNSRNGCGRSPAIACCRDHMMGLAIIQDHRARQGSSLETKYPK